MILQALNEYYKLKVSEGDPDVPLRGWGTAKVVWAFHLDAAGRLVSVTTYADPEKKIRYRAIEVPEQPVRSSGIRPFFLCDKAAYFLGRDKKRGAEMLEACRELHHRILDGVDDAAARAVLAFLDGQLGADDLGEDQLEELDKGGLVVFEYLPDDVLVHEVGEVRDAWEHSLRESDGAGSCQDAVSGERGKPAELFPQVAGFPGAQSAGASLVSYNKDSFCSYGKTTKDKAANASITEETSFNVGTALKYLSQSDRHRISLGDSQVLFWTDADDSAGTDILTLLIDCDSMRRKAGEDAKKLGEIEERLDAIKRGLPSPDYSEDTNFHILGVSPNAARLAIRFYETGTMGDLEQAYRQYLQDVDIVAPNGRGSARYHSIRFYANQTAAFGDPKNVPDVLLCSVMEALVRDRPFPESFYLALIQRTRSDKGYSGKNDRKYDAMAFRAAMFKACLKRFARQRRDGELERSLTVALDRQNANVGYVLGRLFAVLEKVQREAVWGSSRNASGHATIRDRYIGSASATPERVFPQLMKMAQHHISKSEYGGIADREIQEIMGLINSETGYPKTLSYEEQGLFYIGYYQEKASFYAPKANEKTGTDEGQE